MFDEGSLDIKIASVVTISILTNQIFTNKHNDVRPILETIPQKTIVDF